MSAKPRSVLKKRAGNHDDRRVSFAIPLSSEKDAPRAQVAGVSSCPAPKKAKKAAEEIVDIITLGNQQSEIMENVNDVERKFEKQLDTMHGMTNELVMFAEPVAAFSSESMKIHSKISEHSKLLSEVEQQRDSLLEKCKLFATNNSMQSQNSLAILDLQKIIGSINCCGMDETDNEEIFSRYDRVLNLIDNIAAAI